MEKSRRKLGEWLIYQQGYWSYRIDRLPRTVWVWPVRILGQILLFLVFQITNLVAQVRWPFSALVRLIKSFLPIPPGTPIPVNEQKFQKLLAGDLPVLVDFWTEWCGPCLLMEGVIKDFASSHRDRVLVAKVDATINPRLTRKYNVMGYPTLILFVDGNEVTRVVGSVYRRWLAKFVEDQLTKHEEQE